MKVLFLPDKDVSINLCSHRYGAVASVSTCTDQYIAESGIPAELLAFKYNITPTFFVNLNDNVGYDGLLDYARCQFGIYYFTSVWYVNGSVREIPDYSEEHWTENGAQYFNVTVGEAKPFRYPNHGQQIYDLTNGEYGYDFNTNTAGRHNMSEVTGVTEYLQNKFLNKFKHKCSAISYQNGRDECHFWLVDKFLFGRNSEATAPDGDGRTAFGYNNDGFLGYPDVVFSKVDRISQASTTRCWDKGKDLQHVRQQIAKTKLNHGWYNDFTHYHPLYTVNDLSYLESFFSVLDTESSDCWRCGINEAAEYFFLRESIKAVSTKIDGNTIKCYLYISDFLEGNYDKIHTGVSFEVDLANTFLSGKDIKTDVGAIVSKGNDKYVIDVLLNNIDEGVVVITIEESDAPDYMDFSKPQANYSINGNTLAVTSNKETQAVLFSKTGSGTYDYTVNDRDPIFRTEHSFDISGLTGVSVGLLTGERQSILIDII